MSTATSTATTSRTPLVRAASMGAVAGVVASLMMAAYAMIAAATYQGSGFFTPLYHIASVLISPADMMSSMRSATMGGSNFEFFAGPALTQVRWIGLGSAVACDVIRYQRRWPDG